MRKAHQQVLLAQDTYVLDFSQLKRAERKNPPNLLCVRAFCRAFHRIENHAKRTCFSA